MTFTGTIRYQSTKERTIGGVILVSPRTWPITDVMAPSEVRQNVGIGHLLHFCYAEGVFYLIFNEPVGQDNKALICPMAVQERSRDTLSKELDDMPEDYYTESLFALGVVQAEDLRKSHLH